MTLRLEDIERIKQLKYTYSRALDTADMATIATLLAEDASIDFQGGSYHFALQGRDAIVAALAAAVGPHLAGFHTMHMPVIDVHDDGTAEGIWTLLDWAVNLREGNKVTTGSAIYQDRYVCQDGRWLIQHSAYRRVFERVFHDPAPGLTAHLTAMTA
jgi:uncharacterized protein (TIGR02246 family)